MIAVNELDELEGVHTLARATAILLDAYRTVRLALMSLDGMLAHKSAARDANPYPAGSTYWEAWQTGWLAGELRSEEIRSFAAAMRSKSASAEVDPHVSQ